MKQPGGSLVAAVGVGKTYDISAIQAIVKHVAGSTNSKVFFPCDDYLVSDDIATSGLVEFHGTQSGIAVIKAYLEVPGQTGLNTRQKQLQRSRSIPKVG